MKKSIVFREVDGPEGGYWAILGVLGALILVGLGAAVYMETQGHWVTGMNNQVVWGMPHVFAVFLIVAASGALNVASISSVFGRTIYKPLAPLSALLAIALLVGGLVVLVLDLGRPDRLIVAMTHYNFKSIFAWNIILYNGFIAIVAVYLWMMMERKMNRYSKQVGMVAFLWRLILTTGTGSIFGFLVARSAYDAAILAPMFVIMSFAFGLAAFILVVMAIYSFCEREVGEVILERMRKLLGIFVAAVLYFSLVYHLTNLYITEHHGIEEFLLTGGGLVSALFWFGHIVMGCLVPMMLLFSPMMAGSRTSLVGASVLVILGGLMQMYVIIIGGQSYPLELFPGKIASSSYGDGIATSYSATGYELALGIGGVAFALAIVTVAVRVLKFVPLSLADSVVDPHHK